MNQERFKKFAYQLFSIDSPSGFTKHAIDFLEKEDLENFLKELIRHDENTFIVVDE